MPKQEPKQGATAGSTRHAVHQGDSGQEAPDGIAPRRPGLPASLTIPLEASIDYCLIWTYMIPLHRILSHLSTYMVDKPYRSTLFNERGFRHFSSIDLDLANAGAAACINA